MRWLDPERHEGWGLARIMWCVAMLLTWAQRGFYLPERYTDAGAIVRRIYIPVTDYYYFSPTGGWIAYALLMGSLVLVLRNRWARTALVVALVMHAMLSFTEGLNFKGYDRLMAWSGIGLLLAPGRMDGKTAGVPVGRYVVLITYLGLYGQTGWEKIISEPTWWEGTPLAYNMVHRNFGDMPLGVFISDMNWLMVPMAWATLVFEAGFPILYWIRPIRPWFLFLGLLFHLGILVLMNVPNFTTASLAMYPVLFSPDEYVRLRDRAITAWRRLRQAPAGAT